MKFKIRQLPNDMFITEAKRWHDFTWKGVYVVSAYTYGTVECGLTDGVPTVEFVAPGNIHYPLCWAKDAAEAARNIIQVVSILGLKAQTAAEAYDKGVSKARKARESRIAQAIAQARFQARAESWTESLALAKAEGESIESYDRVEKACAEADKARKPYIESLDKALDEAERVYAQSVAEARAKADKHNQGMT